MRVSELARERLRESAPRQRGKRVPTEGEIPDEKSSGTSSTILARQNSNEFELPLLPPPENTPRGTPRARPGRRHVRQDAKRHVRLRETVRSRHGHGPPGRWLTGDGRGRGGGAGGMALTADEVKEAFREFDLDKNGYVGAAEIAHILQSMGEKATDDEVDEMILMADLDGDGQVSFEEFFKLISSFQGLPPPPQHVGAGGMGGMGGMGGQQQGGGMGGGGMGAPPPPGNPMAGHGVVSKDARTQQRGTEENLQAVPRSGHRQERTWWTSTSSRRLLRVERSPFVERLFSMFDTRQDGH